MLAESVYKGVLDNGNFCTERGNFRLSKREFPVALSSTNLKQSARGSSSRAFRDPTIKSDSYYLYHGGYVSAPVCLSVSCTTQKVVDEF